VAETQLPLGRDLFRSTAEIIQRVAAPDNILRLAKLVGSIDPFARAILQKMEFEANAMSVIAVSAMVTGAVCADRPVSSPSMV
jgi:hypothetical protein